MFHCQSAVVLISCLALVGCSWLRSAMTHSAEQSERLVEQARDAEESGEFGRAQRLLAQAVAANPDDIEVHWQHARFLIDRGDMELAGAALEQVVRLAPGDARGWFELAQIRLQQQRYERAWVAVLKVLEIDPKHIDALLLRAKLEEHWQMDERAMDTYHRVLRINPENARAMLRIAAIELRWGKADRAAPMFRCVCQCSEATSRQKAEGLWLLGIAYGQQGRWNDAAVALSAAIKDRRQSTADDWYRVAYAQYQAGAFQSARDAVIAAVFQDRQHKDALAMASWLQARGYAIDLDMGPTLAAGHTIDSPPPPSGW